MKVKLNVLERVLLMNMLPQKGDLVTCRATNNTANVLKITEDEIALYEVQNDGGTTRWNEKGKEEKEFELPPSSVKAVRDILYDLDEKKQLPINTITLCEKFLPEEAKPADA